MSTFVWFRVHTDRRLDGQTNPIHKYISNIKIIKRFIYQHEIKTISKEYLKLENTTSQHKHYKHECRRGLFQTCV